MALKPCKECGRGISSTADKCPHCGASVSFKLPKIGCLGTLALLVFLALIFGSTKSDRKPEAPAASQTISAERQGSDFRRVGGQGQVDFVVIDSAFAADRVAIEQRARNYCDLLRPKWGQVMIWADPYQVPQRLPMSATQAGAQVAQYNRNQSTGYDCFKMLKAEKIVYSSAGCN